MAKRKSTTPTPEDQDLLEQAADTGGTTVNDSAEFPTEQETSTDGTGVHDFPSEETLALMEAEYQAGEKGDTEAPGDETVTQEEDSASEQEYGAAGEHTAEPESEPAAEDPGDVFDDNEPSGGDDYESLLHDFGSQESQTGGDEEKSPVRGDLEEDDRGNAPGETLMLPDESENPAAADVPTPEPDLSASSASGRVPARSVTDRRRDRVLTIAARDDITTEEDRVAFVCHAIQNSHRTRRTLTGTLDGVEKTDSGLTLAVVNYKGIRVAIPVKEMMLYTGKMPSGREYLELMDNLHRILNSRIFSEIDFIVKGYDNDSRSVVGSRRDAMLRKRQTFYMDTNEFGEHMIYEGRVVQARVVAVAEKVIRVEVFGVETSIVARGLSWEWIGNARDHFAVGDRILVRVLRINRTDLEHLSIRADVRSVSATNSHDNLKKCLPQCRYAGRVTDVRNGVVFIRLNNGVNAIAHSCYDTRYPGKKDDVSFAVTRLDEEQGVAIGIITRIIKQNL